MIVCAGEALIDMLPRQIGGGTGFVPVPGGAALNTSVALGRLGMQVSLLTGLSTDMFGQQLAAVLEDSGASTELAVRSDRPTTLAFVTLADGEPRYAFYDEGSAGRMVRYEDFPPLQDAAQVLLIGGISLMADPCGAAYSDLAIAEAASRLIMLDPNIRPALLTDEASYRARLEDLCDIADIVKASDEDMDWLTGGADSTAFAEGLVDRGVTLVLVTHGAGGVTAYGRGAPIHVAAKPVTVADTVGAGDTFNAGLLAGLADAHALDKSSLEQMSAEDLCAAVTLGVAAARVTVSRNGANPPTRSELERS